MFIKNVFEGIHLYFFRFRDFCEESWQNLILPLEVIYFFTKCVKIIPKKLDLSQWDLIEICLASWNLSIKKTVNSQEDFKVKFLAI